MFTSIFLACSLYGCPPANTYQPPQRIETHNYNYNRPQTFGERLGQNLNTMVREHNANVRRQREINALQREYNRKPSAIQNYANTLHAQQLRRSNPKATFCQTTGRTTTCY